MVSHGQDSAVLQDMSDISTDKATSQDQNQLCGCMWLIDELKNAEFICGKVAATRLFKLMLLCAAPARGRQRLSRSVVGSERQEVPL